MAQQSITTEAVRRLASRRWLIPILASISRDGGSRFGVLARQLGISRSVLSCHLDALEGFGWMIRNPGHGHPLRPEYLLTPEGRIVGAWCETASAQQQRFGLERGDLGRWSLPLLFDLHARKQRFGDLQRSLTPITSRALSLALGDMRAARLIEHPAPLYALSDRGYDFAAPLIAW